MGCFASTGLPKNKRNEKEKIDTKHKRNKQMVDKRNFEKLRVNLPLFFFTF